MFVSNILLTYFLCTTGTLDEHVFSKCILCVCISSSSGLLVLVKEMCVRFKNVWLFKQCQPLISPCLYHG